jgi:hypothetical protein
LTACSALRLGRTSCRERLLLQSLMCFTLSEFKIHSTR